MAISIDDVEAGLSGKNPRYAAKKHEGAGGRFYRAFEDIYEGKNRLVDDKCNFYRCTKCKKVMKIDPQKGTAPLLRHADVCYPIAGK